jgi:hypothetical protein
MPELQTPDDYTERTEGGKIMTMDEFADEQDGLNDEEQAVDTTPQPKPMFSLPSFGQGEPAPTPQNQPQAPRTDDDTAISAADEEEIFGTGERSDGSIDEMERTDFDDLFEVGEEDIMGEKSKPQPPKQRFNRTAKKFRPNNTPPPTVGGMQY